MKKTAPILATMTAFPLALLLAVFSVTAVPSSALADKFDPFAAPPKNLKPEDNQYYTTQSAGGEEDVIPAVPAPPPFDGDDVPEPVEPATSAAVYTGVLMESETEGEYLLKTADETITLKTSKDLSQYLGMEIVVETESTETGMAIKSISIGAPETPDEGLLHAAPTGPSAWVMAIVVLGIVIGFLGIGVYRGKDFLALLGNRKKNIFPRDDDSENKLF